MSQERQVFLIRVFATSAGLRQHANAFVADRILVLLKIIHQPHIVLVHLGLPIFLLLEATPLSFWLVSIVSLLNRVK